MNIPEGIPPTHITTCYEICRTIGGDIGAVFPDRPTPSSENDRAIRRIIAYYLHRCGHTHETIGKTMGCSISTVSLMIQQMRASFYEAPKEKNGGTILQAASE